jgi:E3 ubiquitin-protein ligase SHPRH
MEQAIDASPKKKKNAAQRGDFIYKVDDMLAILFPHMFEDIEYLLPSAHDNDDQMADLNVMNAIPHTPATISRSPIQNAQAGPSRVA